MVAATPLDIAPGPQAEQRMVIHASWKDYVLIRDVLDGPGLLMAYSEGVLELMSPGPAHEFAKKSIARFVEQYAYVRGIDLRGYGSTTLKDEAKQRGAEPDECYVVGKKLVDYPEIAIEVVQTSPLVDKLGIYLAFGVSEVWVFRDGAFTLHLLDAAKAAYASARSSRLLPGLDFDVLARFVVRDDTLVALREFEALVRG
jgi:Uma2 family endonuclease